MLDIFPIQALRDNYIWCFEYEPSKLCVVDPGESQPVLDCCNAKGLSIGTILITHHHWDHTDGISGCTDSFPGIPVIGPMEAQSKGVNRVVAANDQVIVGQEAFRVFAIPGHTSGHIAFANSSTLFCGDTLFSGGCGRVFEGTFEQMHHSLTLLSNLDENTLVYPAHEYTTNNLRFALTVEPDNPELQKAYLWAKAQDDIGEPTLPTTLKKEKQINPFLRCNLPSYQNLIPNVTDPKHIFQYIRQLKDNF